MHRGSLCALVFLVTLVSPASATGTPQAPQSSQEDSKNLKPLPPAAARLKALCAASGREASEPVCRTLDTLSDDDAWLIIREACRPWGTVKYPVCQEFRTQYGGALVYDRAKDAWRAEWEFNPYDKLTFNVAGTPTLRLKPGQAKPLKIVVENISPLTYSAKPGTPKEDDLALIADLKSFLALAGTGLQGLVQTIATSAAAIQAPAASESVDSKTPPLTAQNRRKDRPAPPPPPPDPCEIKPPPVGVLATAIGTRLQHLVALDRSMENLDSALDALAARKASFVRAAQKAEDGEVAASDLPTAVPGLEAAYNALEQSAQVLETHSGELVDCHPMLGAYSLLIGAPPNRAVVQSFAQGVMAHSGCTALRDPLRQSAEALATLAAAPSCESKLEAAVKLHHQAMKPLVERLFNAKEMEEKVWQALDKVRAGRKDVFSGADVLQREIQAALRHVWNGQLIRQIAVTRQNPNLSWNKVQTHSIVMKADTPYVKDLTLAYPAEETKEYRLESATGQILGYGVGLIYTPLYQPTWTAASVPDSDKKVIAETGRESRAGDVAAFLSYRIAEHWPNTWRLQPTLDFGVGLSGRMAFFIGGGLEVFRVARISAGWGPQRVSKLAPGQTVNETVVASTDDIRTITEFDTKHYYISVSFALDSLSLFNKP